MYFQEAVQALVDGRCKSIEIGNRIYCVNEEVGSLSLCCSSNGMSCRPKDYLSDEWKLVDPIIEYDEKPAFAFQVWTNNGLNTGCFSNKCEAEAFCGPNSQVVELTGVIKVPKKARVKKRAIVGIASSVLKESIYNLYRLEMKVPAGANITADWEE